MPSYSEWLDAHPPRLATDQERLLDQRRAQRVVELRMEDLLAADDWGVVALHLDGMIADAVANLEAIQLQILGEAVGDELARLKANARYVQGLRDGLQQARALPARLRSGAPEPGQKKPLTTLGGVM